MSNSRELSKLLSDAGVSTNVIRILDDQRLATAGAVNDLTDVDWSRLFELGVKVGDKTTIQTVAREATEPTDFIVASANLKFNLVSITIGVLWAGPALAIGSLNSFGPYDETRPLTTTEFGLLVILPGVIYEILLVIIVEVFRTFFSTDVLQQRSVGASLRDAQRSNLTNMAIVAALLLTVIVAMIQVDPPLPETDRLLPQWYMLFLVASMVPLFGAIIMSSLLLLYIEPLDDSASISFIGPFMDYFGEPIISVIIGVFNFVPALCLWIFGAYGFATGVLASLATVLLMRKVVLTQLYLAAWENPELDAKVKEKRKGEVALPVPDWLVSCMLCGANRPRK